MAPVSASKAARLAAKAAKASSKKGSTDSPSESTASTPMTSLSANASTDDLTTTMAKLAAATDRSATARPVLPC